MKYNPRLVQNPPHSHKGLSSSVFRFRWPTLLVLFAVPETNKPSPKFHAPQARLGAKTPSALQPARTTG